MSDTGARRLAVTIAILVLAVAAAAGVNSRRWLGANFPGFFVLANRVVASITLPGWLDESPAQVLQHQILAMDGVPVDDPHAVYAEVHRRAPGTPIRYTLRAPDGSVVRVTNRVRRFSPLDYALIMGAYLLNGLTFLGVGLVVFALKPRHPASPALLVACVATAVWVITGVDLYGPYWFYRVHVVGESLFGAGLLHFALAFPVNRLRDARRRRWTLLGIYGAAFALAAYYEVVFHRPSAYTAVHLTATVFHGVGVAAVMTSFGWAFATSRSPLLRRRIAVVALGSVVGFVAPGMVLWGSAMLGGSVPINACAFTAFLFPVSLGFAVIKRDLFEIDVLLRRVIVYLIVVGTLTVGYGGVFYAINLLVPTNALVAMSPASLALVNVGLLLLLAPFRTRLETIVDRTFFRLAYDAGTELADFSRHLASARTLHAVTGLVQVALDRTVVPTRFAMYLFKAEGVFHRLGGREFSVLEFRLPPVLAGRIDAGEVAARYEWDEHHPERRPELFDELRADVLVPVRSKDELVGVVVLGPKRDGRAYGAKDIQFLEALSGQVTLAIRNAQAWETLERQREDARRLADERGRLADLRTRFITNASHEFRTPLTTILSATDVLTRYAERLTAEQRVQRLDRVRGAVGRMTELLDDVLTLGRAQAGRLRCERQPVDVGELCRGVLEAARSHATAAHRLELGGDALRCRADIDAKLLRLVLENLVNNAIKYSPEGGPIRLEATHDDGVLSFRVVDCGIGIAPEDQPSLFEPFQRGSNVTALEGSGLGLAIAHEAVAVHGGTMTLESTLGKGTTFVVTVPATVAPIVAAGAENDGPVRIVVDRPAAPTEAPHDGGPGPVARAIRSSG